jgi:hypothetical protein
MNLKEVIRKISEVEIGNKKKGIFRCYSKDEHSYVQVRALHRFWGNPIDAGVDILVYGWFTGTYSIMMDYAAFYNGIKTGYAIKKEVKVSFTLPGNGWEQLA